MISFLKSLWSTFSSILFLAGVLVVIQVFIFKKPINDVKRFAFGILISGLGLYFFLRGAEISLIPLGESVGSGLSVIKRQWVIVVIAFVIGYFATLVEPALRAVGYQVETLSVGTIPQNLLLQSVAVGFGIGMAIGIFRIMKDIPYLFIAGPWLLIILVLMFFTPEMFRSIAWDAAASTTGPVNIPINMAIALGLASIIEGIDPLTAGFGVVGLTSLGAVSAVLILGVIAG